MMFVLQKAADVVVEDDSIKNIALPVTERSKGMYYGGVEEVLFNGYVQGGDYFLRISISSQCF